MLPLVLMMVMMMMMMMVSLTVAALLLLSFVKSVHEGLSSELVKYYDRGHFMTTTFPELLALIQDKAALEL